MDFNLMKNIKKFFSRSNAIKITDGIHSSDKAYERIADRIEVFLKFANRS